MSHLKAAQRIGVEHETISVEFNSTQKSWRSPNTKKWGSVEEAALSYFRGQGWTGYAGEGGLILNLIKAASFRRLDIRHRGTFVEALYAQNVAFDEDRFEVEDLLRNVRRATKGQIVHNFKIMTDRRMHVFKYDFFEHRTSSCALDYFPDLKKEQFVGLFDALGTDGLHRIAERFSLDPYEYRKGWPDLTLWKGKDVRFKEVKSPGDRIRRSQKVIFTDILVPLGYESSIVDVEAASIK